MSKKKFMNRIQVAIFAILAVFVMCSVSWAATYYVDATNGNNDNPGTFAEPWKTIGKANTTLVADDTVYIRTGTYEETIRPDNSGTEGNYITYAQYEDEEVTITGVSDGGDLTNRSYIVIDGFKIMHVSGNWIKLRPNGDHNIIRNCYMEGAGGWSGIYMGGQDSTETNYNQILDNTLIASLDSPCGPHDVIYLRDGGRYNLIEGNSISYSAHVAINIIWKVGDPGDPAPDMFNVIRNNTIQNKWHTSISTFPNGNATLIENNTILDSGEEYTENACGSERDRTMSRKDHKGIQHGARNSIIRHNVLINNGCMAVRTKGASWPSSINNRIYHNTFHENYYGIYSYGAPVYDNIFKNNIFFDQRNYEMYIGGITDPDDNYYINNDISDASIYMNPHGTQSLSWFETNYSTEWYDNIAVNPLFVDESNRDLHLQPSSPMIDAGTFLTKTTSSSNGTSIQVEDARYFMDGWGIIEGDLIQLEGQTQTVRIVNVDYDSNIITVDQSISWNKAQGVSLAYHGSAPDIGAYEYTLGVSAPPAPPSNLRTL